MADYQRAAGDLLNADAVRKRQRLYKLGELVRPDPAPDSAARVATTGDAAVARALHLAFAADVGHDDAPERLIADRVQAGQLMLWEVGGEQVSIAGVSPVSGESRGSAPFTRLRGAAGVATAVPSPPRSASWPPVAARHRWSCSRTWRIRRAIRRTASSATGRSRTGRCSLSRADLPWPGRRAPPEYHRY